MNHVDLVRRSYEAFSQRDLPSLLATFDAGSPSEEDPRRTNDGHGQRALHSP